MGGAAAAAAASDDAAAWLQGTGGTRPALVRGAAGDNDGNSVDGNNDGNNDGSAQRHGAFLALCAIARLHQVAADPDSLAHQLGLAPSEPVGVDVLLRAARLLGLNARLVRTSADRLVHTPLPALAIMRSAEPAAGVAAGGKVCLLAQCDGERVLVSEPGLARRVVTNTDATATATLAPEAAIAGASNADTVAAAPATRTASTAFAASTTFAAPATPATPAAPVAPVAPAAHANTGVLGAAFAGPRIESLDAFAARWSGQLILVASRASMVGALARFDFSWFVPALVKYRHLLGEVLLVSFMLQLFALVSPLFFQVVMDKVLVHQALTTLDVLVAGLVIVVVFESVLSAVRSHVLSHTTSRIDVELGARLFRHLLALPVAYFQARRVGDSVARVRELENIRGFLTGQALTVVLDLFFALVFLAVMCVYSVALTSIVLASLPLYLALSLAVTPVLRRRLDAQFARGAENQAMLVETVTAIETVKAAALEPGFARRWDQQLAAYVSAGFRTRMLSSLAHEGVNLIGKLVNAATLWYGAHLVMGNQLTVGQFVAFTMFAQRVAQPIMRMAQLWTEFQQTGVSMARLGDILNTRSEVVSAGSLQLPPIRGAIMLERVRFRYRPDGPLVLDDVDLSIGAGEVVGVVGRSGSGKSTLAKLVQRLHTAEGGRVLVDGADISLIDAAQLRRQIGVVLQDNLLFNRSIRENIAIADPAAPLQAVARAAQLAGAHDFIAALPQAYDTPVGEQGGNLSGGQRQRIAIARALFTDPRILILDEATSALDYESEAILQRNMVQICRGRTVLIIAHRLSALRCAHRIVVLEGGNVVESGSHAQLMRHAGGLYARLWSLQGGGPLAGGVAS